MSPISRTALVLSLCGLCTVTAQAQTVDGYNDIYLDREQTLIIHTILCGDFNNERSLRPTFVYTNTPDIEQGTYFYNSAYGKYSLTFKLAENGKPIAVRAMLKGGETDKAKAKKDQCVLKPVDGLPASLNGRLSQDKLEPNDPKWDKQMAMMAALAGRPAFAKGVYRDQRTASRLDDADGKIYAANQAYLKNAEAKFVKEAARMVNKLKQEYKKADRYAHQHNGKVVADNYPAIEKPLVWTATSERRYNDAVSARNSKIRWDKTFQETFDWYFGLTDLGNSLKTVEAELKGKPEWKEKVLSQWVTVTGVYADGKRLELDFNIKSDDVDGAVFDTMDIIKQKAEAKRRTWIASDKKPREPVDPKRGSNLDIYYPAEKHHLYFAQFRSYKPGENYRLR